jgi:DNA primase
MIEEVRVRNDIVSVVSGYVHLQRQGKRMVGLCPFHSEKTPSFSVDASKQLFYCFGCQKGGNVFHFVMGIENLEFPDVLKQLADRAGITLPESEDDGERERSKLKKDIMALNREAARFFYSSLTRQEGRNAQQYLLGRGLQEKTLRVFGLGFAPDSWDALSRHLQEKGAQPWMLETAGLAASGSNGPHDRFRNRVMFPIFDIRGNIVGFGGRVMDGTQPKYMNSPDTPLYNKSRELYAMNFARVSTSKRIVLVEGYMDVISLHQAGVDTAVASLGTAFTQHQAWMLKKYAEEVVVAYDADAAGQNAALRGAEILEATGCPVRILRIPDGKDPDEYVRNHGAERFRTLLDSSMSLLEFRLLVQKRAHPGQDVEDRVHLLNGMADVLAAHENAIEREMTMAGIAGEYKVSLDSLKTEVDKRLRRQGNGKDTVRSGGSALWNRPVSEGPARNRYDDSELLLLCLLGNENRLFEELLLRRPAAAYRGTVSRVVAAKLYERLQNRHEASLAELANDLPPDAASAMIHMAETRGTVDDADKAVQDLLRRLERIALEDEKQWILENIRSEKDSGRLRELGIELNRVIARMSSLQTVLPT